MEILREWIITIVSVIIFVTFVEILIPNSNHKRYINVVVGFLLMVVILSPLKGLIGGEFNFQEEIMKTSNELELKTALSRIDSIESSNEAAVIKLYKQEIRKQIKNRIEDKTEYLVEEIDIEVKEDSKASDFGLIEGFHITLTEKKEKPVLQNRGKINPIEINISIGRKINNTIEAQSILINNEEDLIKDDLSSFYNVSRDNIKIYILKSNN